MKISGLGSGGWLSLFCAVHFICGLMRVLPCVAQELPAEVPPGMELRVVGNTSLVVPKGAVVTQDDGLIVVESIDRFVARNIEGMSARIDAFEKRIDCLERKLSGVREALSRELPEPESLPENSE